MVVPVATATAAAVAAASAVVAAAAAPAGTAGGFASTLLAAGTAIGGGASGGPVGGGAAAALARTVVLGRPVVLARPVAPVVASAKYTAGDTGGGSPSASAWRHGRTTPWRGSHSTSASSLRLPVLASSGTASPPPPPAAAAGPSFGAPSTNSGWSRPRAVHGSAWRRHRVPAAACCCCCCCCCCRTTAAAAAAGHTPSGHVCCRMATRRLGTPVMRVPHRRHCAMNGPVTTTAPYSGWSYGGTLAAAAAAASSASACRSSCGACLHWPRWYLIATDEGRRSPAPQCRHAHGAPCASARVAPPRPDTTAGGSCLACSAATARWKAATSAASAAPPVSTSTARPRLRSCTVAMSSARRARVTALPRTAPALRSGEMWAPAGGGGPPRLPRHLGGGGNAKCSRTFTLAATKRRTASGGAAPGAPHAPGVRTWAARSGARPHTLL